MQYEVDIRHGLRPTLIAGQVGRDETQSAAVNHARAGEDRSHRRLPGRRVLAKCQRQQSDIAESRTTTPWCSWSGPREEALAPASRDPRLAGLANAQGNGDAGDCANEGLQCPVRNQAGRARRVGQEGHEQDHGREE